MKIVINHKLPFENALSCSKDLLEQLRHEHAGKITNVVQVWTGNSSNFSFRFKNMSISGTISVEPDYIEIDGKLPIAAKLFQGLIEETIKKEADKLLNKCDDKIS